MENVVIWKPFVIKDGKRKANMPDNGKLCRWMATDAGPLGDLKEFTDQSVNGLPKTWNGSVSIRAWRYLEEK